MLFHLIDLSNYLGASVGRHYKVLLLIYNFTVSFNLQYIPFIALPQMHSLFFGSNWIPFTTFLSQPMRHHYILCNLKYSSVITTGSMLYFCIFFIVPPLLSLKARDQVLKPLGPKWWHLPAAKTPKRHFTFVFFHWANFGVLPIYRSPFRWNSTKLQACLLCKPKLRNKSTGCWKGIKC